MILVLVKGFVVDDKENETVNANGNVAVLDASDNVVIVKDVVDVDNEIIKV